MVGTELASFLAAFAVVVVVVFFLSFLLSRNILPLPLLPTAFIYMRVHEQLSSTVKSLLSRLFITSWFFLRNHTAERQQLAPVQGLLMQQQQST